MLGIGKLLTRAITGVVGSATGQTARVAAAAASMALSSSALATASFPARTVMAGGAKALTTTGGASAHVAGLAASEVAAGAGQVLAVPVAGISTTAMHHFPSLRGGGGGGSDPFAGMNLPPAAMSSHK